ncbi:MAG: 50S ribosomal protein L11 methyltransferase [Clostridiales bacterium]|nr:50S ribosomal protein L11 methyltransferase [Clostridiales bacterium]
MDWIRITVKTTTEGSDIISEILSEVSSGGVIIEDKQDIKNYNRPKEEWDYIDEELMDAYEDEVLVRGFISQDENAENSIEYVKEQVQQVYNNNPDFCWGSLEVITEFIKDENWGETWKKYYKPFKPGKVIVIKPSWEEYEKQEGDIILELDPGAAFGTGGHETTKMCIGFLEDYVENEMSVMDVGCGTGILAMCAYLLGAKNVKAIDIDEEAVKVAKRNVENANFDISVECGNLLENFFGKTDIIVANIIADAVMALAPGAMKHLNENGIYITSGIINERADEVEEKIISCGFKKLERKSLGEWTAFVWGK